MLKNVEFGRCGLGSLRKYQSLSKFLWGDSLGARNNKSVGTHIALPAPERMVVGATRWPRAPHGLHEHHAGHACQQNYVAR